MKCWLCGQSAPVNPRIKKPKGSRVRMPGAVVGDSRAQDQEREKGLELAVPLEVRRRKMMFRAISGLQEQIFTN